MSLDCRAAANPVPVVTWRREDGQAIPLRIPTKGRSGGRQQSDQASLHPDAEVKADVVRLADVTRRATGVYECVVTSGVSLPISRRITLLVQCEWTCRRSSGCVSSFLLVAPLIRIPSQAVVSGERGDLLTNRSLTARLVQASVSKPPCPALLR